MSLYDFMFAEDSTMMNHTWFVDALSGKGMSGRAMKTRTDALALGMQNHLGLGLSLPSTLKSHQEYRIHDVVGVVCPNSLDFGTMIWASHKLGCTVATMSSGSTADELKHQIALTGTRTIFAHIDSLERVLRACEQCNIAQNRILVVTDDQYVLVEENVPSFWTVEQLIAFGAAKTPDSLQATLRGVEEAPVAFLCFSSGTTGLRKAVVVPHSSIIANIMQLKKSSIPSNRVGSGDRALGVIPFSHMFGLVTLVHLSPHLGIATVAFKSMPTFDQLLQSIVRLQIGHLYLAPPLVNAFVKHWATPSYDLSFLKTAMIAAAPLNAETEFAFQKLGGKGFIVAQGFGMTECGGLVTGLRSGCAPRRGSVGQLLSSTRAKIVDDNGVILGPGQRGQLCVSGPQICPGYLSNSVATENAFDAEGFLLTGDIAEISDDGHFYIVDRLKYIIKNKGYQVSPAELEAHLLNLDTIRDVGVVGRPDDRCGEVPIAFVVLSRLADGKDEDSIKAKIMRSVQETKSEFKWLHDVHVVESIPRLPSGKIIGKLLKEMAVSKTSHQPHL